MVLYSIATGLCALSPSLPVLLFCRFWVGFGLGGQLPVAVSLVSEFAPPAVRGRLIVLLESFWGLGWLAAALASWGFIPHFGWHSAFWIGALPIFYALWVWKKLPESVPYLLARGRVDEAHALVSRLEAQAGLPVVAEAVVAATATHEPIRFGQLWKPPFARRTLMLWLIWFGIVFSYYGIFTWLPKLLVEQGHTVVKTFEYMLVMILAQLPGYFSAAVLVERIGRKATLASFLFACAACAWFFGQATTPPAILLWGSLMSFFNLGAWGVLYTYTPELYPVRFRAFGSGWAGATGRLGSDLGRKRGGLARTTETGATRGSPRQGVALTVGDRDDRVVEGRVDVCNAVGNVLLDFLAGALGSGNLLRCRITCHLCSGSSYFFNATPALVGPLRVRALVRVRCPRTGRPRRWRRPR